MRDEWTFIVKYLAVSNLVAIILTVYDKKAPRYRLWRIPERVLLWTAAFSGCVGMYVTMKFIRHKTRKPKFMVGIPVIFLLECAIGVGVYAYLHHWIF